MGVDGAALSTTIGSWAGFAFLAVAFWRRRGGAPRGGRLALSGRELGRVVRFGLPNGINWFFEFAAFQMFVNVVVADLGDTSVAALNVVIAINSVSFMPAFGLASAGAILAGQAIGAGDKAGVWPQVKLTLACTAAWMGVIGVFYLVLPQHLIELFDSEGKAPQLVTVGVTMLALSAAWQLFDAVSITLSETLRAAGDTTWTAVVRLVLAWGIFFPAAYVIVTSYGGGAVGAMLCLVAYVAILAGLFAYRFRSGAWKNIELIEPKLV
jgi:MATE family multidrug resistance protein